MNSLYIIWENILILNKVIFLSKNKVLHKYINQSWYNSSGLISKILYHIHTDLINFSIRGEGCTMKQCDRNSGL